MTNPPFYIGLINIIKLFIYTELHGTTMNKCKLKVIIRHFTEYLTKTLRSRCHIQTAESLQIKKVHFIQDLSSLLSRSLSNVILATGKLYSHYSQLATDADYS